MLFLLVAGPVAGQGLDSTRMRYRDALVAVRDALSPIDAGVQTVRRDLGTAADVTIQSKVGRLRAACLAAQIALAGQRPVFEAVRGSTRQTEAARLLVTGMRALDRHLNIHCLEGLTVRDLGIVADSVRAWMPFRSARLREAEQAYYEAAAGFARTVDVRIPPVSPGGQ